MLFLQLSALWDFLGEVFPALTQANPPIIYTHCPMFCSSAATDTVEILIISVIILLTLCQQDWEVHFLHHCMLSAYHSV